MNTAAQITVVIVFFVTWLSYFRVADSHGMMLDPVSRGSLWRFNSSAPKDFNDNAAFCGGFYMHAHINKGKCGLCGDNYADQTPRAHEHGGTFGNGVIVRTYTAGQNAEIAVVITVNHKGYFMFHLCNMDFGPESEECFNAEPLMLEDGSFRYYLNTYMPGTYKTTVMIPSHVICHHCVLRWTYVAGNSWGICDDGSSGVGCGPQENFKGCADISIYPPHAAFF